VSTTSAKGAYTRAHQGVWKAGMPVKTLTPQREFFDNLLVRIHFIIVMISWTGLAPWEFEFPFPGSLPSTFLVLPHTGMPVKPLNTPQNMEMGDPKVHEPQDQRQTPTPCMGYLARKELRFPL